MESVPLVFAIGIGGAVAFFGFIWMITKGLRSGAHQRAMEQEEIRQAELKRARGESS